MDERTITVTGQIYIITNTTTGKQYVGQTLSHRKNRGKYMPFGIEGRLRDHISEAICNTKRKQCWYLNNAIRKDGPGAMTVRLLAECPPEELDGMEQRYIEDCNTLYPNGYNLTRGGKTTRTLSHAFTEPTKQPAKRGGCTHRTESTRALISLQSKTHSNEPDAIALRSANAKQQHLQRKLDRFVGIQFDHTNPDQYITVRKTSVLLKINSSTVRFAGKHETLAELQERAKAFLRLLATSSNCSGNPLEPQLPTSS
jgi:hypothetical protein